MAEQSAIRGPRVNRQPATATWEHEHRWGPGLTDRTSLYVHRTHGGRMSIRYRDQEVEVSGELVPILAEMVAVAAAWSDPKAES